MPSRRTVYLAASWLALAFAAAFVVAFSAGEYRVAFGCAAAIVLCAKTRVQALERLPHRTLFWVHLCAAVPFLVCLAALAFLRQTATLEVATAFLAAAAFATGAVLWLRGLRALIRQAQASGPAGSI